MDSVSADYRNIVEKVMQDYIDFLGSNDQVQAELVFDYIHDRYLLVETGWENGYRIYGTLLHIDIIDHKLWIQHDGTEEGIAVDLVAAGVPKTDIVLSFRPLAERKHTDFAVS
jgi:hypothetical protein